MSGVLIGKGNLGTVTYRDDGHMMIKTQGGYNVITETETGEK